MNFIIDFNVYGIGSSGHSDENIGQLILNLPIFLIPNSLQPNSLQPNNLTTYKTLLTCSFIFSSSSFICTT
ncbi:MAG: hypothetical protein ACOYN4_15815, partial [Bacteroidales bacterium]